MHDQFLSGVFTALVTIFNQNNQIDYDSIGDLIEFQISSGVDGILICGSTGETPTLSENERYELIKFATKKIAKRAVTMVGINFNSTDYACEQAKLYESFGVDCLLVNNPSYNKPSENGMYEHFIKVANSVKIPIIIYNIPSRSIFNLSNDLLNRLFRDGKNIVGMKDSTGSVDRCFFLQQENSKKLSLFCGDDNLGPFYFINGGCGIISVLSNLFPKQIVELYQNLQSEKYREAFLIHRNLMNLSNMAFIETNPVPIKYMLHIIRGYNFSVRLPLLPLSEKNQSLIYDKLKEYNENYSV